MQPGGAGLEGCSIKLAFGKQRAINTHQHEAIRGLIKEDHSLGKMGLVHLDVMPRGIKRLQHNALQRYHHAPLAR